ncbi:hypothetical protein JXJ21_15565 [candidate division KSB1 bacterium]|nr:hypothetical protein [candidate division KSB1 bacterium]
MSFDRQVSVYASNLSNITSQCHVPQLPVAPEKRVTTCNKILILIMLASKIINRQSQIGFYAQIKQVNHHDWVKCDSNVIC